MGLRNHFCACCPATARSFGPVFAEHEPTGTRCTGSYSRFLACMFVSRAQTSYSFDCLTPGPAHKSPELLERDGMYVKDCSRKSMPEAFRYVRISSRTGPENRSLVEALSRVLSGHRPPGSVQNPRH